MASTETAFELDPDAAGLSGDEFVHFANFPGVWAPGRPVAAAELGFESVDDAAARIEELGLPLTRVTVDAGSAAMPARPNHLLSDDGLDRLDELAEKPRRLTHADLDRAATEAGLSFPDGVKSVDAKTAYLEQARTAQENPAAEPGAPVTTETGDEG